MTGGAHTVFVDLRTSPDPVRDATKAVRQLLVASNAISLLDPGALGVTEVVTITVTRTTAPCHLAAWFHPDRRCLRVEVTESRALTAPTHPCVSSPPDPTRFPFVEALATTWGVDTASGGRVVWFEMAAVDVADVPV